MTILDRADRYFAPWSSLYVPANRNTPTPAGFGDFYLVAAAEAFAAEAVEAERSQQIEMWTAAMLDTQWKTRVDAIRECIAVVEAERDSYRADCINEGTRPDNRLLAVFKLSLAALRALLDGES